MATLKGLAVIWAVDGVTCTGAVIASPSKVQSADLGWTRTLTELSDANGETVGVAFSDERRSFTISVIPAATDTEANAVLAGDAMMPAPGTKVTLTDTYCTKATALDADYILETSRLRRTNTGAAVVEMDLIQYSSGLSATI